MSDRGSATALHFAIRDRKWDLVPKLIKDRDDLNLSDKKIGTPLLQAACQPDVPLDVITHLISPQNINMQDMFGYTVLHRVVRQRRWNLVPVLIQHGADLNQRDPQKDDPLHVAMRKQNVPLGIVNQLISPQNINMQYKNGCTALHIVVSEKRWRLVPALLQHGADANLCDNQNNSPLHYAARHANIPWNVVTQLISPQNINIRGRYGYTALYLVVREETWDLVPVLVQHGADVNLCNDYKDTPLLYTTRASNIPIHVVTQLISPQNINMKDKDGCTALNTVAWNKRWDLVPVLVQYGADLNLRDKWLHTPLHDAVSYEDVPLDIVTLLISPQNINKKNGSHSTPLHLVVMKKRWNLVPVLLHYGSNVNLCDENKETPLHASVTQAAVPLDVVTQLISPQNINMKNVEGCTTLNTVARKKRWDLVPILLKKGANVWIKDMYNTLPLAYLLENKHAPEEIVRNLILTGQDQGSVNPYKGWNNLMKIAINSECWQAIPLLIQHGANVRDALPNIASKLTSLKGPELTTLRFLTKTQLLKVQLASGGHTLLQISVRRKIWPLVASLIALGAEPDLSIYDTIEMVMYHYRADTVKRLLQHMPMPYHLTHVEFIFTYSSISKLKLNNTEIMWPKNLDVSLSCLVNIICHLLQQTCLVKAQFSHRVDDIRTIVEASIVSYVMEKHVEFENITENPATLKKLCLVTIRQHLPIKTDENFAKLGLPPQLMSLVTLSGLAEELSLMWWQGKTE